MKRFRYALKGGQAVLILIVTLSCGQVHNQGRRFPQPAHLLPPAPAGWKEAGKPLTFSGVALSDYIDGGAEAYLAYGFREAAVREFRNDADARLTVEIYRMDRPENAYGIFSIDSAGEHWDIGAGSSYGDGLLRFWKGPYFARIMCFPADSSAEAAVRETGANVANAINAESTLPKILEVLPPEGVYSDTVCYFHRQTTLNNIRFLSDENLLHLSDGVEALTWEQSADENPARSDMSKEAEGRLRQIVLLYPSESTATAAFEDFIRGYLRVENSSSAGVREGMPFVAQTSDGRYTAVSAKTPWLLLVLDAGSSKSATKMLAQTEAKLPKGESL